VSAGEGAKPDHVRGICDIVDCDGVACHAFRDAGGEVYVEVCDEHVSSFDGFDSDYERVEHDSPYREPARVGTHDCGGTLHVYDVPTKEDDDGDAEHRVCTDCGYALLVEHTGENEMSVRSTLGNPEEKEV
jgi:hypothetical protein